jgi:hypothetical protein
VIREEVPAAPSAFVVAAVVWAVTGSWIASASAVGSLVAVAALRARASHGGLGDITSSAELDRTHRGRAGSYVCQRAVSLVCLGAGSCAILARMRYDGAAGEVIALATGSAIGVCVCVLLDHLPHTLGFSAPDPGGAAVCVIALTAAAAAAMALAAGWVGQWEPLPSAIGLTLLLGAFAASRLARTTAKPERAGSH